MPWIDKIFFIGRRRVSKKPGSRSARIKRCGWLSEFSARCSMKSLRRYNFSLVNRSKCQNQAFRRYGALVDDDTYKCVVEVAKFYKPDYRLDDDDVILFNWSPEEPGTRAILELLAKAGITPKFQYELEPEESEKYFTIRTGWQATRRQVQKAEYFQITTLIYDSSHVGKLYGIGENHAARVAATQEDWKRTHELAELLECFFVVSDRFRRRFEEAGLVGLKLHDITWYLLTSGQGWRIGDPTEDPRGRKWMDSTVVLPPCLTPRRYMAGPLMGKVVGEEKPEHPHCFDSEGLAPAILRFDRAAVARLGTFDVAVTRERVHRTQRYVKPEYPGNFVDTDYWLPVVIVSRRFKEWFTKSDLHGRRHVQFRLVELV